MSDYDKIKVGSMKEMVRAVYGDEAADDDEIVSFYEGVNKTAFEVFADRYHLEKLAHTDRFGWVKYDFNKLVTRPPEPGKYFVRRKDGKVHWETWNGSGWAYNGNVITHWCEIYFPEDDEVNDNRSMNIFALRGHKVMVTEQSLKNGYDADRDAVCKYLEVGKEYTVNFTQVHSSSTDVFLVGFDGVTFNSVNLVSITRQPEELNMAHPDYKTYN